MAEYGHRVFNVLAISSNKTTIWNKKQGTYLLYNVDLKRIAAVLFILLLYYHNNYIFEDILSSGSAPCAVKEVAWSEWKRYFMIFQLTHLSHFIIIITFL